MAITNAKGIDNLTTTYPYEAYPYGAPFEIRVVLHLAMAHLLLDMRHQASPRPVACCRFPSCADIILALRF